MTRQGGRKKKKSGDTTPKKTNPSQQKKKNITSPNQFEALTEEPVKVKCRACNKEFTDDEENMPHLLECERCSKWQCQACSNLSDTE